MEIPGLLRSQIEELGREVRKAGFDPREFASTKTTYKFAGPAPVPAIAYRHGGVFAFARHYRGFAYSEHVEDIGHAVGFAPGVASPFEKRGPLEWPDVVAAFRAWLTALRREAAMIDVWSMPPEAESLTSDNGDADAPFTPQEQSDLRDRLSRIEELLVKSAGDQRDAAQQIRKDIAELREEVAKMNRGKWKKFALGTLASLSFKEVVTPDRIRQAVGVLSEFFAETAGRLGSGVP